MAAEPPAPRATFDTVADVYHRVRPGYPPALFDDLFAMLPDRPRIVEVGPGTGQATRDLLARGAIVHAVELGPAMATTLRRELPSADLTITVGDFEQVPPAAAARTTRCSRPRRTTGSSRPLRWPGRPSCSRRAAWWRSST